MSGKGIESTELEELLRSLQLIEEIQIPENEEDNYIEAFFTERERQTLEGRVKGARKAKKKGIPLGRQGAGSGRAHWSAKRKRAREYSKYVAYPRQMRNMALKIGQEGWYDTMLRGWKRLGFDVQLTKEEWNEHVEPILRAAKAVPFTERYYSWNPVVRLDNILIYGRAEKTRHSKPIFDGAEWKMKALGYIV